MVRADPGTGFEPVFLDSETSVLPARRSRSEARSRRAGRSGGNRTLTTPGKSRVRFRLRYGPECAHERAVGREGLEPSPLGLKARCSAVELASRASDAPSTAFE